LAIESLSEYDSKAIFSFLFYKALFCYGIEYTNPITHFIYKAEFDNGLTEHELDYVLKGISDNSPIINPEEVNDFRWISIDELNNWVKSNPTDFTVWFLELFKLGIIA
jgi:isopentenyldiphosphate isomerase